MEGPWDVVLGDGPLVATAVHHGHEVRPEVAALLRIDDAARLQEEDPHTARWTTVAPTRLVAHRSRFEVDLNRPRETAVYRTAGQAWGLDVWRDPPTDDLVERSLDLHDRWYALLADVVEERLAGHGAVLVLDCHSYNHRRGGACGEPDDPRLNPEVNVGTGTLDRRRWGDLVERFVAELAAVDVGDGRRLDVRENVRFRGGHQSRWLHERYGGRVCCLALEWKKTWMDEWTGVVDEPATARLVDALGTTVPGLLASLA